MLLLKPLIDKKMTNVEPAGKSGFSANIITRLKRDSIVDFVPYYAED